MPGMKFLRGMVASSKLLEQIPFLDSPRYHKLGEILSATGELDISDSLSRHFTRRHLNELLNIARDYRARLIDLENTPFKSDFINTVLAADYKTYLADDILTKIDRATMSVGLEGREPFLDHRIVEWAAQLPSSLKYNTGKKKYLLKKLTHRYLPASMMDRPKMGFGIPVNKWLRGDLRPLVLDIISSKNLRKHNLLNEDAVIKLRDKYLASSTSDTAQLWLILMFQMWWNEWMD
jgi:asparagine synthase (glutamine-hydrolysing)